MGIGGRLSPKLASTGIILAGVLIFALSVSIGAGFWPASGQKVDDPQGVSAVTPVETAGNDPLMVVIIGVDRRPGDRGRSDTVMVASVNPKTKHVGLISLPRDMWVEIPGRGFTKLNHAFAYGGAELTVETVSHFLDLPLEDYVVIDFDGFEAIVDAVGGVEIDVEKRLYYHDPYQDLLIDLQPGLQRLNGEKALHYARFRNDAAGDIGRMERQQKFMRALAKAAASPSNILRIPSLIRNTFDAIETNIPLSRVLSYANSARTLAGAEIASETISGPGIRVAGISYLKPDLPEIRATAYRVLLDQEPPEKVLAKAREDQAKIENALAAARAQEPRPPAAQKPEEKEDGDDPGAAPPAPGDPAVIEIEDPGAGDDDLGDDPGDEPGPGEWEDGQDPAPEPPDQDEPGEDPTAGSPGAGDESGDEPRDEPAEEPGQGQTGGGGGDDDLGF